MGPALRLVGIVGFLVAVTGLLELRIGASTDMSARAGGILGQLVGNSLYRGFGPMGGNLFLLALLLISITLATGLSWLAVMDRIGKAVLSAWPRLSKLFRRSSRQAGEWQRARIARALAQDGEALVLDEPTTFLDIAHEMAMFELLDGLARLPGGGIERRHANGTCSR